MGTKLVATGPYEAVEVTVHAVRDTSTGTLVTVHGALKTFDTAEAAEAYAAQVTGWNKATTFLPSRSRTEN